MYFSPDIIVIIVCFFSSLSVYFQADPPFYLKLFPFFLSLTLVIEAIGSYLTNHDRTNIPLYNFFSVFEFVFYFFLLREIISNKRIRKFTLYLFWIYPLLSTINILFVQKISQFHTMTYSLGCLLVVFISIFYFFELFQMKQSIKLSRDPAFWICSGLLFFYSCTFPLFGLLNFLNNAPLFIDRNLGSILTIMNVLLYLLFTIALLCRISIRKSM
jgi:hypothetical protein